MILVDSDVLIAHLRGIEPARHWLRKARTTGPLAVSVVSIAELTGGMRSAERREVWALLGALRAEPVTELVARRAGEFMRQYRRSHSRIGIADYLIAATAELHGQQLATLNVRHSPCSSTCGHRSESRNTSTVLQRSGAAHRPSYSTAAAAPDQPGRAEPR